MSHKATNWAVSQRGLKPIAKVLLWHLADRHHPDNGCFPSQAALAADCEISRASVNRHLDDLEASGLIRREPRIDKSTGKQLPTRYVLAFEDDFGTPDVVARVSESDTVPCLKNDDNRVSEMAETVSHSSETLTSKGTSKGTSLESERVSFNEVWAIYPRRLMTDRREAETAWAQLSDDETVRCLVATRRTAQWHVEDCADRGVDVEAQKEYRTGLGKWLRSGAWIKALSLPLRFDPTSATADDLAVIVEGDEDFLAVTRLRGKAPIVGSSGKVTVTKAELEQARQRTAA